jgi:enediyne biosynthesis protein E11
MKKTLAPPPGSLKCDRKDGLMPAHRDVIADLIEAGDEVDRMVTDLDDSQWKLPTPAPGWTIAHQIAHLTATFRLAATAAGDPPAFTALATRLSDDFNANVTAALTPYLAHPPAVLLGHWRTARADAEHSLAAVPAGQLVPWLVRPLPAPILAAAGMMELFGHGQDIADALRIRREHTDRLEPLVAFAVRTWDFGYLARGMVPPDVRFRYEITAPSGVVWRHGPAGADQVIAGPAADFCLLVTRRRHRADLALKAIGSDADRWLDIAQAYRGPAGPGRSPGQFAAPP